MIWIQTSNKANQSKHWSFRHTKHKPPHRCLPAQCAGNPSSTSTRSSCFPLLVQIPGISGTSSQDCWNECRFFSTVGRPQMYLCHKEHSWPVKKWYEGKYVQCLSRIKHLSICNINIRPGHTTGIWHPFPGSRAFDRSAAGVGNLTDCTSDQTQADGCLLLMLLIVVVVVVAVTVANGCCCWLVISGCCHCCHCYYCYWWWLMLLQT